jgi:hypothetical protein
MENFTKEIKRDPASFRDPSSIVYAGRGKIIREVYPSYFKEYDHMMHEIYPQLIQHDLIINHRELFRDEYRMVIAPEVVEFINYPYEWNFNQLKRAALATLKINSIALTHGMMLKDASAYNIQIYKNSERLIDTCSFMFYCGDTPWPAYSQFLRHFLNPLLLMKYVHPHENKLSQIYIDGIPTPYTANRLPLNCRFSPGIWTHTYIQSWSDLFKDINPKRTIHMSRVQLIAFLNNLYHLVSGLKFKPALDHGWIKYADAGSYSPESLAHKKDIVKQLFDRIPIRSILDLGANTGDYSRLAAGLGIDVVAVDQDHDCMYDLDRNSGILPLVVDLCNPSPAIGWGNSERRSFWERMGKVDCILALALIHHLSIRNNVPLEMVADLFADHTYKYLIIEWVPSDDKQAKKLLGNKIIPAYNEYKFFDSFAKRFNIIWQNNISGSERKILLMEKK